MANPIKLFRSDSNEQGELLKKNLILQKSKSYRVKK